MRNLLTHKHSLNLRYTVQESILYHVELDRTFRVIPLLKESILYMWS